MVQRAFFSCALMVTWLLAVCQPVSAQESNFDLPIIEQIAWPWLSHLAITILGIILAVRLALVAFARPVQVANLPTFPRYMTSHLQYQFGRWVFVLFACSFFLLLVYEHQQVLAVADIVGEGFAKKFMDGIKDAAASRSTPYLIIVAAMGAVYLFLLGKEAQWNVLLIMRDAIRGWISVPQLAKLIVGQINTALKVPTGAIRDVIDSCKALNDQDFRKDRNLPDRQWAEICYMKWWLTPRQDAGKDVSFFTEESFGFRGLIADFEDTGWRMERWKSGEADRLSATGFPNSVRELHEKFSRLIACYLIYRNASKQDLYEEAKDFGIDMGISPPVNPLHYWIVYVIALAVSVYVGVHASAFIYDWLFAVPSSAENSDRAMRWMMYSLSNYGLAIMGILLLRFATGSGKAGLLQSHLIIYCWTFAVGYVLGPFGLALAVHKFGTGSYPTMDLYLVYYKMLKWGLGPALVCVYISYYLDRQTCDDLPDIVHSSATVGWRLLNCFGFAAITVFLLLPELLSLVAQGEKPAWETGKLRFVATGTTFFVVFGLALAAQFALRKGMESSGAVFSPPANRMEPAG